jgi:hypothetical protein
VSLWLAASTVATFVVVPIAHPGEPAIKATTQGGQATLRRYAQISAHGKTMALELSGNCTKEEIPATTVAARRSG